MIRMKGRLMNICGPILYLVSSDLRFSYVSSKAAALGHRDAKVVLEARQEMVNTPHTSCFD